MEIFSAEQIRAWDQYTIQHEPVSSVDLMERAAGACFSWLEANGYLGRSFSIFCGKGNNGGDGLAIARLLDARDCRVVVYILEFGHKGTDDFQTNLARLHGTGVEVIYIQGVENIPAIPASDVIVDALLGSGLSRGLDGVTAELVNRLNATGNEILSIDIPTGLFVDQSSKDNIVVRAAHTLSFQCYKTAFLLPENEATVGEVHILPIGLHPDYLKQVSGEYELLDPPIIRAIFKPRKNFAHKGNFGHSLLMTGSYGKIGASVLSGRACLRAGVGLLTCQVPRCGYTILQSTIPEAMVLTDDDEHIHTSFSGELDKYSVIGIGPGIGTDERTVAFVRDVLTRFRKPMVVDSDALNILSTHPELFDLLPPYSILTPHPKEFERLFGASANDFDRLAKAREAARKRQCIIVLKGHYTFIAMPGGKGFFNSTGNAGMAKGGSGDVLTGILTAILSQGYGSSEAALLGVYLHGLAGDLAAEADSQESMLPSDLTDQLGKAFRTIQKIQ